MPLDRPAFAGHRALGSPYLCFAIYCILSTHAGGKSPFPILRSASAEVMMIFRQLLDPETSTYTYLLADEASREAVLIDSVLGQIDRDITLLRELDLDLCYVLDTHVHADHVTASGRLRENYGCKIGIGEAAGVNNADLELQDGEIILFGESRLEVMSTPGHTKGCLTYLCRDMEMAFTGDVLLIRGCGRTDFQQGDAAALFASVRERLFELPDDTLVYPGHDYHGRMVSTVREEKRFNARIRLDKSLEEFVEIMNELDLAYPKQMDVAVPANLDSGLSISSERPDRHSLDQSGTVASVMEKSGRQDAEIWIGGGI